MKKSWIAIIIIIVVAAGVWWAQGGNIGSLVMTSASPTAMPSASKTPAVKPKASNSPAPTQSLSYTQLVQAYGTNRIQFDQNCQAQPATPVFKNGTSILLDNRSNQAREITVNGTKYSLGAYGYQVVTLSSSSLPKTLGVNCNSRVNVSSILLQANISGQ
jgi:hypothetical protein